MMKPEASPFHNPVSSCEASDAGVVNTRASIDPGGVANVKQTNKVNDKASQG